MPLEREPTTNTNRHVILEIMTSPAFQHHRISTTLLVWSIPKSDRTMPGPFAHELHFEAVVAAMTIYLSL